MRLLTSDRWMLVALLPLCLLLVASVPTIAFFPELRLDVGTAPGTVQAAQPDIHVDGDLVVAAWYDERVSPSAILARSSVDGGVSWTSDPVQVSDVGIPAFKVRGQWRFKRVDLDRWIEQQKVASRSEGGI